MGADPRAVGDPGLLAGLDTDLRLGTLVSPVTFRAPGIIAKTVATLDALSGVGLSAVLVRAGGCVSTRPTDWTFRRRPSAWINCSAVSRRCEHSGHPGTKAYAGRYVNLPETTCYPRPTGPIPIIVGGSGERRTLKIVAEQADGCNLPSEEHVLSSKIDILRRHCAAMGRDPAEVEITILDLPVIGRDREDVGLRVERLRGSHPSRRLRSPTPRGYAQEPRRALSPAGGSRRRHHLLLARGPGRR